MGDQTLIRWIVVSVAILDRTCVFNATSASVSRLSTPGVTLGAMTQPRWSLRTASARRSAWSWTAWTQMIAASVPTATSAARLIAAC